ncbi:hypothetical protein ES692_06285 [Psychroserpens burtonensis]|uniref:Lipoprotein n=1 Tax=Psychroserpens burtonensis TaxID=49278 RepID=A0A5C7B939_9FLAO|nr:hypothetical protein [Psychroserpens burtonensis]TXE18648.1 hypothetical protein ES692_06285 [Psychroserpens burtonensis]
MKHLYLLLVSVVLFSCGNERILQLPEIENAKITEINDVSHAYLFYDETKEDSIELNRKNLIITTNWLVNVDKRLTLAQAIPKIKFLQEKKRNAELHKNEDAKNYFTCNDTSIKNLGFLEFTNVVYDLIDIKQDSTGIQTLKSKTESNNMAGYHAQSTLSLIINEDKKIKIGNEIIFIEELSKTMEYLVNEYNFIGFHLKLYLNQNLSFQDYISIKSKISTLESDTISIANNEFIY